MTMATQNCLVLTEQAIKAINDIIARGRTAEIRVRKDKLVIVEMVGKVKCEVVSAG